MFFNNGLQRNQQDLGEIQEIQACHPKKIKNIERHPCNKFIPEVKTFLASYLFVVSGLAVALGYSGEIKKIDAPTPTSKLSTQDAEGKKFTCKR